MEEEKVESADKIQTFYDACTEMTKAKFILADAKISKILKSILSSSEIVDVIAETLNNFNFQNEFSKIQVKNELRGTRITLPMDNRKLVAIVFSLLSEIDSHRIDLHNFIFDYFNGSNTTLLEAYDLFVEEVILPFRDAMCEILGVEFEEEGEDTEFMFDEDGNDTIPLEDVDIESMRPEYSVDEVEGQQNQEDYATLVEAFFGDIRVILTQIKDTINMDPKIKADRKDELNITIDALLITITYKNLKILNALMISLNYLLRPVRSVRFYNMELQNRLALFYSEIY